ncbi:hypothetical protein [Methylobacterium sp. Gmos1]
MARAQVTVSGSPGIGDLRNRQGAIHRRDAIRNMLLAADFRGEAIRIADERPIRACHLRKQARTALDSALVCDRLARSYGHHIPTGA